MDTLNQIHPNDYDQFGINVMNYFFSLRNGSQKFKNQDFRDFSSSVIVKSMQQPKF